jgi:polyisoprenoid-binding protein YceI
MRLTGWKSAAVSASVILCLTVLLSAAPGPPHARRSAPIATAAQSASHPILLTVDPAQTKIHYIVDTTLHTVHGTFNLKSGTLQFDPQTGKAEGAIVVYATSGESGNTSRDERMHKEILETPKYPEATFHPGQIDGQVSLTAPSDFKLKGLLNLHGGDHDLVVLVHSEFNGEHWKGTAQFDVPYIEWGIKDPSNFLLKVKPVVHIELEMAGTQSIAK